MREFRSISGKVTRKGQLIKTIEIPSTIQRGLVAAWVRRKTCLTEKRFATFKLLICVLPIFFFHGNECSFCGPSFVPVGKAMWIKVLQNPGSQGKGGHQLESTCPLPYIWMVCLVLPEKMSYGSRRQRIEWGAMISGKIFVESLSWEGKNDRELKSETWGNWGEAKA